MVKKAVFVADPGIDGAFALTLAMFDPNIEVLAACATAGNVKHEQATRNVHIVVEQTDPPRWPRVGAALPIEYELDGTGLHGPGGLGGTDLPCAKLHHPHPSDKLIVDMVRHHPREVTVVLLGPATTFVRALDRDPELAALVERVVFLGGSWHEPGNATAVAEFHFHCDPLAARQVLRCGAPILLVPLDAMRKVVFSPTDLLSLPASESPPGQFLSKIVPYGIRTTANLYGIEGFHLKDVLGTIALARPDALTTKPMVADVEVRGELTRGMSVFDTRWVCKARPNVDAVVNVDLDVIRRYITDTLQNAGETGNAEA